MVDFVNEKFIIKDPTACPNCQKTAMGYDSIVQNFGLRSMSDGIIRVQSWCKECRTKGVCGVA